MITVTLRKELSKKKDKIYLYLDFYPAVFNPKTRKSSRRQYLHMFLYPKPQNEVQRNYNEETLKQAEAIRASKSISIINRYYGFPDSTTRSADFLKYFESFLNKHDKDWTMAYRRFSGFVHGKCTFGDLNVKLFDDFKHYLLYDAESWARGSGNARPERLNVNTAAKFYIIVRRILKEAWKDGLITEDINLKLSNIPYQRSHREFLTRDEVIKLYETPCRYKVLKDASMFSIFTGLRISDILSLTWDEIVQAPDGKPCIRKVIEKTKRDEVIFISEAALSFCGERGEGRVFPDLRRSMTIVPLRQWIEDSGIGKHITFHCFRHTYATLLISSGVDIYTVSGQLTHADIGTTQIYTHLIDSKKRVASEVITLKNLKEGMPDYDPRSYNQPLM